MKSPVTPDLFQQLALTFIAFRWHLLAWSAFGFILFPLLQLQIQSQTPTWLVWVALFILFAALQALVLAAFIFFFQNLPSSKATDRYWFRVYRTVEWCETVLFALLLPLPTLIFIYALLL
ncbi:hypothetical protein [Thalassotalea sp. PLHSN55]|uniref:hypothetical protein n=1 Tax=Thalassotalea sp. PLHSN55 TaxID=3435888 RepID=UPI003F84F557